MEDQKIRIKLLAFDKKLIDRASEDIVNTVKRTGAIARGPIPLPRTRNVFTVNKSPHVDKKSREQFEIRTQKRLIDIIQTNAQTLEALGKLDLPSGVEVDIKILNAA